MQTWSMATNQATRKKKLQQSLKSFTERKFRKPPRTDFEISNITFHIIILADCMTS